MNITDMKQGERAVILSVECSPRLKERLRTLNLHAGGVVRVQKVSFFKKTFLVQAGGSRVVLGREVARCVGVRKV